MPNNYYTGIGSRKTPSDILSIIEKISRFLYSNRFILRSGAAPGADIHFERQAGEYKEIYLPWRGFNGSSSPYFNISENDIEMAKRFHPNWDGLSAPAKKLMSRNSKQVLGANLDSPSSFVICWTPGGKDAGGTSQAIRIARFFDIPVYNLGNDLVLKLWEDIINSD